MFTLINADSVTQVAGSVVRAGAVAGTCVLALADSLVDSSNIFGVRLDDVAPGAAGPITMLQSGTLVRLTEAALTGDQIYLSADVGGLGTKIEPPILIPLGIAFNPVVVGGHDYANIVSNDPSEFIPTSQKGSAGGVATLGTDGLVPVSELPTLESQTSLLNTSNWVGETPTATCNYLGIAYGAGTFVAVGVGAPRVATSPTGAVWTNQTPAATNAWTAVCYDDVHSVFIAVSKTGTNNRAMTSSNGGVTWISHTSAANLVWSCVASHGGTTIAVASDGSTTNCVMRSTDGGVTWAIISAIAGPFWRGIAWQDGQWVVVGQPVAGSSVMVSADDGLTWSIRHGVQDTVTDWVGVAAGNGLLVAVGENGASGTTFNSMISSDAGDTWTLQDTLYDNYYGGIGFGAGLFVAVGIDGTTRVATTQDGISWQRGLTPQDNTWNSVAYGAGVFVAVASSGTQRAMVSTLVTAMLNQPFLKSSSNAMDTSTASTDWDSRIVQNFVIAGAVYTIDLGIFCTLDVTGGGAFNFTGVAAQKLSCEMVAYDNTSGAVVGAMALTALGVPFNVVGPTDCFVSGRGLFIPNASGSFSLDFGQVTPSGTSTVEVSWLSLTRLL